MNELGPSCLWACTVSLHCVQLHWNLEAVAAVQTSFAQSCKLWLNNSYPEESGQGVDVWIITPTAAFHIFYQVCPPRSVHMSKSVMPFLEQRGANCNSLPTRRLKMKRDTE